MAAAGGYGPLEYPTWGLLLRTDASNGWVTTPRASGYNFWGCWGCEWPSKHSDVVAMHNRRSKGVLWGAYTPSTPPKITSAILGCCHPSFRSVGVERKASCGALGGHFCRRWPLLWWLWHQLCFVLRLLKNAIKTLKLVVCKQCLYTINYTL